MADPAAEGLLSGGQMACAMLFGTAILTYLGLEISRLRVLMRDGVDPATRHSASKHSEPLSMTFPSLYAFFRDTAALGIILLVAFMCEKYPYHPRAEKTWDKDMYWFLCLLLLVASLLTMKKGKSTDILNRDQTEEWKGWMQFMFLLYHYYKAEEVYNAIRIMITCYVWMTGFGNFSFFYIKQDFGFVRFVQMLWRLNFLVILLCLSQGNTYILYYICPLHTFYFGLVYLTMRIAPQANHGKWDIRFKLFIVALLVYLIWDLLGGELFNILFGTFLGKAPVIGAKSGTLWEWYFRTSLDHWSTVLGMIFALNFPMATRWLTKIEEQPIAQQIRVKGLTGLLIAAPFLWWATTIFPQSKLDYNSTNSYYGFIPLLFYIFFRNLTPSLRAWHSSLLHDIGKVTLETYLMQHHIWLTSNAKTLLVLLPNYPKCNLVLASVFFVYLSRQTFYITMSLRGMVLPDDRRRCINGTLATITLLASLYGLGCLLSLLHLGFVTAALLAGVAATLLLAVVHKRLNLNLWGQVRTGPSGSGGLTGLRAPSSPESLVSLGRVVGTCVFAAFLLTLPLREQPLPGKEITPSAAAMGGAGGGAAAPAAPIAGSGPPVHNLATVAPVKKVSSLSAGSLACLDAVNDGRWNDKVEWVWSASSSLDTDKAPSSTKGGCNFKTYTPTELKDLYRNKQVTVVGDSIGRQYYYALLASLGSPSPMAHDPDALKHQDLAYTGTDGEDEGLNISFLWRPFAKDVDAELSHQLTTTTSPTSTILLLSFGLWDTLHLTPKDDLHTSLKGITSNLAALGERSERTVSTGTNTQTPTQKIFRSWLVPTTIVNERLQTEEKKERMTELLVGEMRKVMVMSGLPGQVDMVLDGAKVSEGQGGRSEDGVHYDDGLYAALVQVGANGVGVWEREVGGGGERGLKPQGKSQQTQSQTKGKEKEKEKAKQKEQHHRRLSVRDLDDVADWEDWRVLPDSDSNTHTHTHTHTHRILKATTTTPKEIDGTMSSPFHGAIVLAVVILMLLTFDIYAGASVLGMFLGRTDASTVTWQEAYEPLLSKILRASPAPTPPSVANSSGGVGGEGVGGGGGGHHRGVSITHTHTGSAVRGRYTPVPQGEIELGGVDQPHSPSDSGPTPANEE